MPKPKILALHDKSGCSWWRSYAPLTALHKSGLADVKFLELRFASKKDLAEAAHGCDIVQAMGLIDVEALMALRRYQELGLKVVIDCDDLHFNVSPWNTAFRHFGMEDVEIRDPKTGLTQWLWKDGQNGFNIKANKLKFHAYQKVLQEANLITTTTVYLKEALTEVAGGQINCRVLPNAINFGNWKPIHNIRDKFSDKFRFGWAVSGSHGEDWLFIRPALLKFLKAHRDAKFVIIGDTYFDVKDGMEDCGDQIEWYPFSDLWEGHYALRMPLLGLDAAIAPLADLEFNKCKSPLKYEEYTAFGWPVVAQNMTPYKEHIVNGDTGLLASSTDDWFNCLEALYKDEALRAKLRFNAQMMVKDFFDLDKIKYEYLHVYQHLLYGQETKLTQTGDITK